MSVKVGEEKMNVTLLDSTKDPAWLISMCARTCYNSRSKDTPESRFQFIKGLIKSGHETPLENAVATFDIKGISRTCMAQITRHRMASFCVQSMRYVNVEDNDIIVPHKLLLEYPDVLTYVKEIKEVYGELVKLGVPKEDARFLLPLGTTTNLTMTMNFRSLRHFLKLRLHPTAQWEIRCLAYQIYKICESKWPWLVEDIAGEQL